MQTTSPSFKSNARQALADPDLQQALTKMKVGFVANRASAVAKLPEFDTLRDEGRDIKNHVLANLDTYLERFEAKVTESGGQVHWCRTADEARRTILDICRSVDAKTVTKGKSMIGEEIGINDFLEENGVTPVEDRSRRIHHPAPQGAAEPHHRAGDSRAEGESRGILLRDS